MLELDSQPTPPSSSAAATAIQPTAPPAAREGLSSTRVMLYVMAAVIMVCGMFTVGVFAVIDELKASQAESTKALREQSLALERASDWMKENAKTIDHRLKDIEIKVPPTNDKLFTILSKGVGVPEDVIRTSTIGTTPTAAFVTDLTAGQQTDAYTQEVSLFNNDDLDDLCYKVVAWSVAGATGALKCAAQTITCSGASTDGLLLPPGGSVTRRWDGTALVCVVASAATTPYQSERVLRRGTRWRLRRRRFRCVR